jgi:hypothetical protein
MVPPLFHWVFRMISFPSPNPRLVLSYQIPRPPPQAKAAYAKHIIPAGDIVLEWGSPLWNQPPQAEGASGSHRRSQRLHGIPQGYESLVWLYRRLVMPVFVPPNCVNLYANSLSLKFAQTCTNLCALPIHSPILNPLSFSPSLNSKNLGRVGWGDIRSSVVPQTTSTAWYLNMKEPPDVVVPHSVPRFLRGSFLKNEYPPPSLFSLRDPYPKGYPKFMVFWEGEVGRGSFLTRSRGSFTGFVPQNGSTAWYLNMKKPTSVFVPHSFFKLEHHFSSLIFRKSPGFPAGLSETVTLQERCSWTHES